jgi:hypothetical protein
MNQCKIINLDIYWVKYLIDELWYFRYELWRLVKLKQLSPLIGEDRN